MIIVPNVKPHELMGVLNKATIGISPNLRVAQQINPDTHEVIGIWRPAYLGGQ